MQEHEDCLRCRAVPCINFYENEHESKQELALLNEHSNFLERELHPPCIFGVCLMALCRFLRKLWELVEVDKLPSTLFYLQAFRDLKASILLLLTGHYRSSMAILRGVLENFYIGIYFDYKILSTRDEEIIYYAKEYIKTGKYKIPEEDYQILKNIKDFSEDKFLWFSNILEYLRAVDVVPQNTYSDLNKLKNALHGYVHPKWLEVPERGYPVCPASVEIVKRDYNSCVKNMQEALTYMIETAINLYNKKYNVIEEKELIDSLKYLTKLDDFEKEFGIQAIFPKRLRKLVNEIRSKYRKI